MRNAPSTLLQLQGRPGSPATIAAASAGCHDLLFHSGGCLQCASDGRQMERVQGTPLLDSVQHQPYVLDAAEV